MKDKYCLKMPTAIYSGKNALENINSILQDNSVQRLAVFTASSLIELGLLDIVKAQISIEDLEIKVFDDTLVEPSYMEVQNLIDRCKTFKPDFILGLGGGSVIDCAKLASILMTGDLTVKDLLENSKSAKKEVKTLIIPTTAGTGAEATPNAIVAVPEKQLKVGIVNDEMISDYVILDVRFVENLPRKIAAATGIDALAHAIECFTGNKANPFSDLFALKALEIIFGNIEEACDNPKAYEQKNNMQVASFYAGIAISTSGTTAVHALSYPLGGKYHIAHGVANAILLTPVMRFNEDSIRERLVRVYDSCFKGKIKTDLEKSDFVIREMERIVKHLDIPTKLNEFGVSKNDLDDLVESGLSVTRLLNNNMKQVKREDAKMIYSEVLA